MTSRFACARAILVVAVAAVLAPGDLLPPLRGRDLTGHGVTFPVATRGSIALLALGFTYDSRFAVDAWADRHRADFAGERRVRTYRVPMIGGLGKVARGFIDGGMRKNTPRELHGFTVTVYDDVGDWKRRLAERGGDVAHLLLLDRAGRVAFRHSGAFDAVAADSLTAATRRLLALP
jgi:hypothetical protein